MPAMILSGLMCVADVIASLVMLFAYGRWRDAALLISMPIFNASILIFLIGIITTITEWKNIHARPAKKILYALTFPFFMLTYIPIAMVAVFKKVEWKPINHSKAVSLEEIHADGCNEREPGGSARIDMTVVRKAHDNNEI